MLPALPTGMEWTVGASPSASTISKRRLLALDTAGLMDVDNLNPAAPRAPADGQCLVERARTGDLRPVDQRWASFAERIWPAASTTAHSRPARAAYAAGRR